MIGTSGARDIDVCVIDTPRPANADIKMLYRGYADAVLSRVHDESRVSRDGIRQAALISTGVGKVDAAETRCPCPEAAGRRVKIHLLASVQAYTCGADDVFQSSLFNH
jgi:hypothetical protein